MRDRGRTALLMAGFVAVPFVLAPAAHARPSRTCDQAGSSTICQTNGSVSIKAEPGTFAAPATLPLIPWLTYGGRRR